DRPRPDLDGRRLRCHPAQRSWSYGPLLSDHGITWLGTAALLRAPDPEEARAILTPGRYADIEVHSWQFGGRES
ncbi:MAG TPA: hypothetical protein VK802_11825, partial [Streptosporangiaceae bacterium]|nr:hypothetical protein [Streptosporangiaceae bacterium]